MDASEYEKMYRFEANHWWFESRRKILKHLLRRFMPDRQSRILDVGCGTGHHLLYLRRLGYPNVQGQDLSPLAIAFCQQLGVNDVVQCDATRMPFAAGQFDALLVMDVLEHLPNERTALQEFWRVLKPGGIILLTVPAFSFLWSHHDEVLHHYRRYRHRDVARLAAANGFQIADWTYFFCAIFPAVVAYRMAAKLLRFDQTSDLEATAEPFNTLLKLVSSVEIRLFRYVHRLPFGTSLAVVLQKSAAAAPATDAPRAL